MSVDLVTDTDVLCIIALIVKKEPEWLIDVLKPGPLAEDLAANSLTSAVKAIDRDMYNLMLRHISSSYD